MRRGAAAAFVLSAAAALGADCTRTSTGLEPLDAPFFRMYHGFAGGLYPGGNARPAAHAQAGREAAAAIRPIDGRVVFLSIGMSNTTQEFTAFQQLPGGDPEKSPQVLLVDGAQGGWTASLIASNPEPYWSVVMDRLHAAGAAPEQVQAAWLKEADAQPTLPFPDDAKMLSGELQTIVLSLRARFPNLRIVYLSSRVYGGYASVALNPEPYAYQGAFAVRWLIERQIDGDLGDAPWLAWGPYLWADGTRARFDGLAWACADFGDDGTHPSGSGRRKVARMLLDFLHSDETARPWFVKAAGAVPQPRLASLVNAAGYFQRVAPGGIAALFGTDLAGGAYTADGVPLPPGLGGATVTVGGQAAPLYFVSPGQINLLVPANPVDNRVVVRREGVESAPLTATLALNSPGLFTADGKTAAALHADGAAVTSQSPATRGETVQVFGTGKGLRNPAILAPDFLPVVRVGGVSAEVKYWGPAPGWPGMDQVNVVVPADAAAGAAVPLELQLGGFAANQVFISVK